MIIRGANLGNEEVEYRPLAEYQYFRDERQDTLKKLEQLYFSSVVEARQSKINPFPQKDGKVEISAGMPNHRCTNDIESIRAIAQYGILASEWFGKRESEMEGTFCAFVEKVHSEEDPEIGKMAELENHRRLTAGNNLLLFFDNNNPVMKKLLHLDFFEFVTIKQLNPDRLTEMYTSDELEIFERLIEPFSPAGRDFHMTKSLPYCDWVAIPGGIPSALVNGICTKTVGTEKYPDEYIAELAKLFPNATIFDGNRFVIHTPEKQKPESPTNPAGDER